MNHSVERGLKNSVVSHLFTYEDMVDAVIRYKTGAYEDGVDYVNHFIEDPAQFILIEGKQAVFFLIHNRRVIDVTHDIDVLESIFMGLKRVNDFDNTDISKAVDDLVSEVLSPFANRSDLVDVVRNSDGAGLLRDDILAKITEMIDGDYDLSMEILAVLSPQMEGAIPVADKLDLLALRTSRHSRLFDPTEVHQGRPLGLRLLSEVAPGRYFSVMGRYYGYSGEVFDDLFVPLVREFGDNATYHSPTFLNISEMAYQFISRGDEALTGR